jgi:MYXO-CTERM domain-containing protein
MNPSRRAGTVAGLLAAGSLSASVFVGFEDLSTPPALTASGSLFEANGNSLNYGGVVWDNRVRVTGSQNRTGNDLNNPLSGLPRGGSSYFLTNEAYPDAGGGILLQTTQVLEGAWFSQVEYYGYGHPSMTITIEALNGVTVLGSASVVLSANAGSTPLPMEFLDSSAFSSLSGITGYRINQDPLEAGSRYWSADDFQFAAVPEPGLVGVAAAGALGLFAVGARRRRCRNS